MPPTRTGPVTPPATPSSGFHVYNALSDAIEPLIARSSGSKAAAVTMFVSGTATDEGANVSAARALMVFDVLVRALRMRGGVVTLARAQDGDEAGAGTTFDIFCGEVASDTKPAASVWLRAAVGSTGSTPLHDVLARNDVDALRYAALGTHYRAPLLLETETGTDGTASFPAVDDAERRVDYLYTTRAALLRFADGARPHQATGMALQAAVLAEAPERLLAALENDLDARGALAALTDIARTGNEVLMQAAKTKDARALLGARGLAAKAAKGITNGGATLGLLQAPHDDYAARTTARRLALRKLDADSVQAKVDERVAARAAKEFDRADALRAELETLGIELFDSAAATTWRVHV